MTDPEATARSDADASRDGLDDFIAALTLRRALVAFVATALAILALSVIVGFAASDEGFGWEVASIFGTAVGTTLLALVTGLLAIGTWKDVRASQAMVELTRDEQYERIRPVVIGGVA